MDSLLSFTLLYLFVGPMLARIKMTKTRASELDSGEADPDSSALAEIARKNFRVSSIQIFSTFICYVILFSNRMVAKNSNDLRIQALSMTVLIVAPIDTPVNALYNHRC